VGLGAIVLIGAEFEGVHSALAPASEPETLLAAPLACMEILGRSTTDRAVERETKRK